MTFDRYKEYFRDTYFQLTSAQKEPIIKQHLDRVKKGKEFWNEWAKEFEKLSPHVRQDFVIDFSGVVITDDFSFDGFYFPCIVLFSSTTFIANAKFNNATFKGTLNFSKAKVTDSAEFIHASFYSNAEFVGVSFGRFDANFSDACFYGDKVNFSDATFPEQKHRVNFNQTKFDVKDANFSNVEFGQKEVTFSHARFKNKAKFSGSSFQGNVIFSDVIFCDSVEFKNTRYSGQYNDFKNALFLKDVNFKGALFSGVADFRVKRFDSDVFFEASVFENAVIFENAQFSKVPDFNFAQFNQPPHLDSISIAKPISMTEVNLVERYRKLKQMAMQSNDHENELKFFALETEAKGSLASTSEPQKFIINIYKEVSNFGQSLKFPLYNLVFFLVIMCLINCVFVAGTLFSKKCEEYDIGYSHSIVYTLSQAFPLFYLDHEKENEIEECFFNEDSFGVWTDFSKSTWSLVHLLPTTLLLFLFGLGVRNRFKI